MGEINKREYPALELLYKEGRIGMKPSHRFFQIKAQFGSRAIEPEVETTFVFNDEANADMDGFLVNGARYKITIEKI